MFPFNIPWKHHKNTEGGKKWEYWPVMIDLTTAIFAKFLLKWKKTQKNK